MKKRSRILIAAIIVCFLIKQYCMCLEMRIYDNGPTTSKFINIYATSEFSSNFSQFYNCMESYNSQLCALDLQPTHSSNFTVLDVIQNNETKESNRSTFRCLYSINRVNCTRMSSDCESNVTKCRSGLFHILWQYSSEYLMDEGLTNCTNLNRCTVYTIERTNTTLAPSTLLSSTTATISTTIENTFTTYELTTLFAHTSTFNNESTSPFKNTSLKASSQSLNNNIIIIIVVVSVCSLFIIVIIIFCVRKFRIQKKTKTNAVYSNVIPDNISPNPDNYSEIVLSGTCESPTTRVESTDYYQNDLPSTLPETGAKKDCFTNLPLMYYNSEGNEVNADSNNKLFPNPAFSLDDTYSTHYSRLGDHVKKFKHVYNCSPMDSERNPGSDTSHYSTIDLSDTPVALVQDDHINPNTSAAYTYSLVVIRK